MQVKCLYDKLVPLSDLKLNPNNRNIHSPEQLNRLAEILAYQGWRYCVKVSNQSGIVTSGHGRIEAARINGWSAAPVNFQDYDNADQEYADSIADNSIASWAELDLSGIQMDIKGLSTEFNVSLLGLKDFTLLGVEDKLDNPDDDLQDTSNEESDSDKPEKEDIIPDHIEPRVKPGEQYAIGEHRVLNGDCLKLLRTLPDDSLDSLVTDPPYGWSFMGKGWDNFEIQKRANSHRVTKTYVGSDGKTRSTENDNKSLAAGDYDRTLSGNHKFQEWTTEWAKEALRVLKPGAHALIFCGPRTYHRMASGIEDAGFEVRDQIQWLFGSGFPKSLDISKAIDKAAPTMYMEYKETAPSTDAAKKWQGFGTALKPANEPILLARKPLEKGLSIAENVLKWGCGGINIDGSRVGSETIKTQAKKQMYGTGSSNNGNPYIIDNRDIPESFHQGRFPANLVLSHDEDCQLVGTKKVKVGDPNRFSKTDGGTFVAKFDNAPQSNIGNGDGTETVESWLCSPHCAVKMLDEQSGTLHPGGQKSCGSKDANSTFGIGIGIERKAVFKDSGGASRFFYCSKPSKSEKNLGCEGLPEKKAGPLNMRTDAHSEENNMTTKPAANSHPTIKPTRLMSYLIRLITPPGGTVLEPFGGSGTTLVAAHKHGFSTILIEQNPEYCDIILARAEHFIDKSAVIIK